MIRVLPSSFLLFEKVINVLHANAPQAKLCFNTKPSDTAEAVRRWGLTHALRFSLFPRRGLMSFLCPRPVRGTPLVVVPASQNPDLFLLHLVDKAVLLIYTSRPAATQFAFQRLRLAQSRQRSSLRLPNQANNAKRLRAIPLHPPREVLESRRVKFQASQ